MRRFLQGGGVVLRGVVLRGSCTEEGFLLAGVTSQGVTSFVLDEADDLLDKKMDVQVRPPASTTQQHSPLGVLPLVTQCPPLSVSPSSACCTSRLI